MRRLLLPLILLLALPLSAASVRDAYRDHVSHAMVSGRGTVVSLLRDDTRGSRHQRFILRVDGGPTVLVAHNIDIARRVAPLRKGDRLEFYGEYLWNPKGGIVHWTHRDPSGRHTAGWLKRRGETFD